MKKYLLTFIHLSTKLKFEGSKFVNSSLSTSVQDKVSDKIPHMPPYLNLGKT